MPRKTGRGFGGKNGIRGVRGKKTGRTKVGSALRSKGMTARSKPTMKIGPPRTAKRPTMKIGPPRTARKRPTMKVGPPRTARRR